MTIERHDRLKWELPGSGVDTLHLSGSSTSSKEATSPSRLQQMIFTPLGLFLIWVPVGMILVAAVFAKSFIAYLADADPGLAARLSSANPVAFLNLAQAKIELIGRDPVSPVTSQGEPEPEGKEQLSVREDNVSAISNLPSDSKDRAQLRSWAERVLRKDPLNARAFRILGQLAASESNELLTKNLMQAASRRSLRESDAIYWMMQKSYEAGDYHAALRFADILLRTRPNSVEHVMPVLGKIAESGNDDDKLQQLLAANPPWRRRFLELLPANITDARTPLKILLSLKDSPVPPTLHDLRSYLNLLTDKGFHELAYYAWLQFLPPEQFGRVGLLFNGDFEVTPSGLPFDWVFSGGSGVVAKIVERLDKEDDHALFLEFGVGRVDFPRIRQLLTLAPGRYRFQGNANVDIVSQRGLQWRIVCSGKGTTEIGESPTLQGSGAGWQNFSFTFTVPDTDCPAQYVELLFNARWASERFISGSVWLDDIQIVRVT